MISKRAATWIILALMLPLPVTCFRVSAVDSVDYIPNEVIVCFKEKISSEHIGLIEDQGGVAIDRIDARGLVLVRIPEDRTSAFINALQRNRLAKYAERNHVDKPSFTPNDPMWNLQWNMPIVQADRAWDIEIGSKEILVAVVDSGIDYNHEELANNYQPGGYDWDSNDPDPYPDAEYTGKDHGTHCAGIIAAILNNGIGVTGLAQVKVLAQKIFGTGDKTGTHWAMAQAFYNSTDLGAKIISYSASGTNSTTKYDAVKYAYEHDVLIVAAAGNEDTSDPTNCYPAAYDEVVSVAATNINDERASYSNWGDWIEISAPGGDTGNQIYSAFVNGYGYMYGTSMACPHVSGVAALIWSLFPEYTRNQVRDLLRSSADDLGDLGWDPYYGFGRVNAYLAVNRPPTTPVVTSPNGGEIWKGTQDIKWTLSTDPDTDNPPTYHIQYSSSGGGAWNPLVDGIPEISYPWDTTSCPDSANYLVRVRAYDGDVYSQWDQSDSVFTVDNEPPITTIKHTPGSSTISLSASDSASGVEATNYRVNGGDWALYTEPILFTETSHTMDCYSVDVAGNIESPPKSLTVHSLAINVSPPESGLTSPAAGTYWYDSGSLVTVGETPASGHTFDHWDLDGSDEGKGTSCTVTMDAPHTLTAIFKIVVYDATIKAYCNAEGKEVIISFTWDGDSYTTPQTFADQTLGHTVAVAENDDSGHPFVKWIKDDVHYSTDKTITISSGGAYTAIYAIQRNLTVISAHGSPNPPVGNNLYFDGDSVTCNVVSPVTENTAVWTCSGWSGTGSVPSSGSGTSVTFTITENSSITWNWESAQTAFKDGFEYGNFIAWNSTSLSTGETATVVNTLKHHGTYSGRFASNGGGGTEYSYCYKTVASSSELYARGYFYVSQTTLPQDGSRLFFIVFRTASNQLAFAGWRRTGGVVKWTLTTRNGTKYVDVFSSASLAKSRWYCIELHWKGDSLNGLAEMWADGKLVCSSYGINTAAFGMVTQVRVGLPQIMYCGSTTVYCDCATIATAYVGPELVTSTLTVTSPNGGESWVRGTIHPITWTSTGSVGASVKIEVLKSGVVKGAVTTANDGYWSWTISSSHLGSDYRIRIISTSDPAITDVSDADFAITAGGATGTLTVTSPNGGESWKRGTAHPITWTSAGSVGSYVKIEILKNGVVKGSTTTANDGSYSWTIASTHLGTDYKVRITSTSNPAISDSSDNSFTITS